MNIETSADHCPAATDDPLFWVGDSGSIYVRTEYGTLLKLHKEGSDANDVGQERRVSSMEPYKPLNGTLTITQKVD